MAEANQTVAIRDPDALLSEIERTRQDLARTIDELTDRVSPGNVARRATARLREQASRPEVRLAGAAIAAAVALGAAAYLVRRRRS
jgi:hypothetical protein